MTRDELVKAALEFAENRVNRLTVETWLNVATNKLINRKRYWWRKKFFTLNTTAAKATYALDAADTSHLADHFQQMITFRRFDSNGSFVGTVQFRNDPAVVAQILADQTTQGEPANWIIEPGTTRTLRINPVPSGLFILIGYYWAGFNSTAWASETSIPLLPEDYHYVLLAGFMRHLFLYLYGQKDPRFPAIDAEYKDGLNDLDRYRNPSPDEVPSMRTSDPNDTIRATS